MANPFDPLNQLQGTMFGQGYNALYGAYNNGQGYDFGNNTGTNQQGMGTNSGTINTQSTANYGNYLLPYLSQYNTQQSTTDELGNTQAPTYDATQGSQDIFGLAKQGMNVRYEMGNNQFYVTDPVTGFKFNVVDGKASNVTGTVDPSKAWTAQYSTPTSSGDMGFSGGDQTNSVPQLTGYVLNQPYQSLQNILAQLGSDYKFVAPKIQQPWQASQSGGNKDGGAQSRGYGGYQGGGVSSGGFGSSSGSASGGVTG